MPRRIKSKHQHVATLEAEMVRHVRAHGGVSRVQLARALKLSPSTAGIYVDRLIREDFLLETAAAAGRDGAGRPPTALVPNPDGGRFIGVDFEARNLMATVVDFSQQPLRQVHETLCPSDSKAKILTKIERAIDEMLTGDARHVLGIGVGVPGAIDTVANVAMHYPFIKDWRDVPLGARLHERFGVPVFLENNIRSMALAELWFGAGRNSQNFVCIGIRSGVAAGVVVDGRLLHGAQRRAGEIGHWICPGAKPERLEHVASLSAIAAAAQRSRRRSVTADEVLAAARDGNKWALTLVRDVGRVHGWVAHQLNELFNPEKIIFAGPLADLGDLFLAPVRETAGELGDPGRMPCIVSSTLGQYNGAVGAAALALHQWKPKR